MTRRDWLILACLLAFAAAAITVAVALSGNNPPDWPKGWMR